MVKVKLPKKIKTSLGHIQRRSPRYSAPKLVKKESGDGFTEQNDGSAMNSDANNGTCALPFNLGNYSTPLLNTGDSQVVVCPETLAEGSEMEGSEIEGSEIERSEFPIESVDVTPSSSTSRLLYHSIQDSHFIPSEGNSQVTHCPGTPSSISGSTLCTSRNSDLQKTRNTKKVSRKNKRKTKVSLVVEKTKKQKGKEDNICKTCNKKFGLRQNLHQHEKIHSGIKNHKCPLCGFAFVQLATLYRHIRRQHTKEKPYKCQVENCRLAFATSGDLKAHQLVHNKNDESLKKYQCSLCFYKTVWKGSLKTHQNGTHSNIRAFKCPFLSCEYAAKWRSELNRHIKKIHKNQSSADESEEVSEKTDNICKTCNKIFGHPISLKMHEKIHLRVKNQCTLCGDSFAQKSHLEEHIRFKHTKERPFKCQVENCRYSAAASGNLKKHQLTHNKKDESLKKYQCSLCSYKTVRKWGLNRHQKFTHVNIRDFKCPFLSCEYAAKWRSHLTEHVKRKHKNQSPPSSSVTPAVSVLLESLEVIQEEDEEAEPLVNIVVENQHDEISAGENLIQGEEVEMTLTGQNEESIFSILRISLNSKGGLVYVVQESSGNSSSSFKYFSGKQVREKFPLLVITFFESNPNYWKCPEGCQNAFH